MEAGRRDGENAMTHDDGEFAGQGGTRLYWQAWHPDGEPRAVLLVAHGYGEHGGRYGDLAERLVARGYAVYSLDHRGHGRSEGARGHVGRFAEFVADLHAMRVRVEAENRGKPLVVLGHSMGGLIAVRYLLNHASGISGAVLSSPALGLAEEPPRSLQLLGRVLSVVAPRTSFQGNVNPELLSHDPAVGAAYVADPLVHRRASARFFTELKWAIANVADRGPEIRPPILVLQAADDRLVDPRATEAFAAAIPAAHKTVRFYPGFYHEIFNETGKERVLGDLERWLDALVGAIDAPESAAARAIAR
jgi:alpha-beta hydrolase superfamily lysophospholipase